MVRDLVETLDPTRYFLRLKVSLYLWQAFILNAVAQGYTRIIINGARQAGKSTDVAGIPLLIHKALGPGLSLVLASSERQSNLDIGKILDYVGRDNELIPAGIGSDHVTFEDGANIVALPATEKTVRGHSAPQVIILDEAARIPDALYFGGIRPMLTDNPRCVLVMLSTGWGKRGVFYNTWMHPVGNWLRVEVKAPWDIVGGRLEPAMPEEEYQKIRAAEGIHAFYSPRHADRAFMKEELEIVGERWVRQEYLCEFVDNMGGFFNMDAVRGALQGSTKPLFSPRADGKAKPVDPQFRPLFEKGVA